MNQCRKPHSSRYVSIKSVFCLLSCLKGVMESFLGTALAGTVFCVFGGQPLIILSSTGPILIFEKLLYEFSK